MKRKEIIINKIDSTLIEQIIANSDKNCAERNKTNIKNETIIPLEISKAQKLNLAIIEFEWGQTN